MRRLDRFFEITDRGSTLGAEVRGGVVTFIAMAYIIVLNPIILSGSTDVAGNQLQFTQVSAVTALAAGFMTILFGLVTRLPFAFAAGLGINSFLATSVVGVVTWPEAMGLVVINGLIIVALAASGLRRMVFDAVPLQLKLAITAGIGAFILFIGLVDAGFVGSTGLPSPPVGLGGNGQGSLSGVPTVVFLVTLLLTGVLVARRVRGGILIGLVGGTVIAIAAEAVLHLGSAAEQPGGWRLSVPALSGSPFAWPDLSLVGAVSLGSFERIGALAAGVLVFTLVFANFFDALGTFTGLSREAGLAAPDGTFPRLPSALIVEGAGAVAGGVTSLACPPDTDPPLDEPGLKQLFGTLTLHLDYFQFRFVSKGKGAKATYTAEAKGDPSCDGKVITMTQTGSVDDKGNVVTTPIATKE